VRQPAHVWLGRRLGRMATHLQRGVYDYIRERSLLQFSVALIIVAKVAMQVGYLCVVIYFAEDPAD